MKRKSRPGSGIQVEMIKMLCCVETRLFLFVSPTPPASVRNIIPPFVHEGLKAGIFYSLLAKIFAVCGGKHVLLW